MKNISRRLGAASVRVVGDCLCARTGVLERTWRWTGQGLATESVRHLPTGREWCDGPATGCDWGVGGLVDDGTEAVLASLAARAVRRSPWTSPHVEVVADVRYPRSRLRVQYVVWVYPDSPGIRTQLRVRGMRGYRPVEAASGRVERVPVAFGSARRRAMGYYNQTQRRNRRDTPLLREELVTRRLRGVETFDWASLLCVEDAGEGLCLVKESHKCVNQQGVDTGAFVCSDRGVEVTGLGPSPSDVLVGRFRDCWATWCIVYAGGDAEREAAIKSFDRIRYPIDPRRDVFIMANTWGSTSCGSEAREAARESNVLREIDSAADLGIDVQQIDDGWQGNQYRRWRPVKARYPVGWRRVRAAARRHGVTLGLWAAWGIPEAALKWSHDRGGFRYFKLDFANLDTYAKVESLMAKVRALVEHSGHRVRVNWDVTENPARVGYCFAREFGNIYLENRKPVWPAEAVYVPWLVLRDAWQVARYTNLQKFQISVQNLDRVDPALSNAHLHSHPYCVAIPLMGSPIFFQETHYYTAAARAQIRPLLALYKVHREAMFRGLVYPIGDEPSDASWTGFQNHDAATGSGYLTLFRELGNDQRSARIALRFLAGKAIELTDLRRGTRRRRRVARDGTLSFRIAQPADFLFLRYVVQR